MPTNLRDVVTVFGNIKLPKIATFFKSDYVLSLGSMSKGICMSSFDFSWMNFIWVLIHSHEIVVFWFPHMSSPAAHDFSLGTMNKGIRVSSYDFSAMISIWVLILSNELYVSPIIMSSPAMITHWEMRCFDAHGELLWKLIVRPLPFFTFKVQMYYYFSWCVSIGVCCVLALWIARWPYMLRDMGSSLILSNSVGILHYYRSLNFKRRSREKLWSLDLSGLLTITNIIPVTLLVEKIKRGRGNKKEMNHSFKMSIWNLF